MASLEEHSDGHLEEKAAALADTSIQLRRAPRLEEDPLRRAPRLEEDQLPPAPCIKEEQPLSHPLEVSATTCDFLDNRPYACGQCGKTYRHGGSLVNHKKIHQIGNYQCGVCCRQYPNMSAYRNHLRNHPRCKLNGSVPEVRQPAPAEGGAGEPSSACEMPREEPVADEVLAAQTGADPPHASSLMSPSGEERSGQGREQNANQPENKKARVFDICGVMYEAKAASEALQPLQFSKEQKKVGRDEEEADQEGGDGPSAEEEGSPSDKPWSRKSAPTGVGSVGAPTATRAASSTTRRATRSDTLPAPSAPRPTPTSCPSRTTSLQVATAAAQAPAPAAQAGSSAEARAGPFQCPLCPKRFPSQAALRNHSRVHSKKRFECSECGKAYRASRDLIKKLEERPYKCSSCERTYRHAGSLLNHRKAHKTGLYRCSACQKEFYNLLALKNHLHTHTDRKRHRCPHCGKAFRTARRLAAHARAHGGAKEEGTFLCGVCSKEFFHPLSFQQHQLSHTADDAHPVAGDDGATGEAS
uniref:C2H2-type domain-containing protein n=1 Tax=Varanus komodoensis TaxID=61221 RepID=A0A8D2IV87_VARKO